MNKVSFVFGCGLLPSVGNVSGEIAKACFPPKSDVFLDQLLMELKEKIVGIQDAFGLLESLLVVAFLSGLSLACFLHLFPLHVQDRIFKCKKIAESSGCLTKVDLDWILIYESVLHGLALVSQLEQIAFWSAMIE
eukprot:scaffold4582_cov166-Amphora_coffeaeformis.AAC.1